MAKKTQTYNNLNAAVKQLNLENQSIQLQAFVDSDNDKKAYVEDASNTFDKDFIEDNTTAKDILKALADAYNKDRQKKLWKYKAKIKKQDDSSKHPTIIFTRNPLFILLPILLLALLVGGFFYLNREGVIVNTNPTATADVEEGTDIDVPEESFDSSEYAVYSGFGEFEITADQQCVPLINDTSNAVYMQYTVMLDGETLYETGLIEPGKMVEYNAYENLDAGEYTLVYNITNYDLETKVQDGVCGQMEQKIKVVK